MVLLIGLLLFAVYNLYWLKLMIATNMEDEEFSDFDPDCTNPCRFLNKHMAYIYTEDGFFFL